jgi:hypothetical protein
MPGFLNPLPHYLWREVKAAGRQRGKQTVASPLVDERFQSLCQSNGFSQYLEMKEKPSFFQRGRFKSSRTDLSGHGDRY